MSEITAGAVRPLWRALLDGRTEATRRDAPDVRRLLQLALAGIWLLDGVLQFQGFMFSKAFSQMLAGTADGNPRIIAGPITWDANLVARHGVPLNTLFAAIQLLLGIGIACRLTVRLALAASIAWALGVWWFGEGLGMVLTGGVSPVTGAPGAVILYALLAVLLWPSDRDGRSAAARAVGVRAARAAWLVLWLSLAYFAVLPANRAPQAMHDMLAGMADGEPPWLASIDRGAASVVAHQGLAAAIVLAIVLTIVAFGVCLRPAAARGVLILAMVVAGTIWVLGQDFGAIFAGGATDPNSGPLLALLALTYWPARRRDAHIMIPAPILDIFAAVMLAVAAVSAARLVAVPLVTARLVTARLVTARPWQRAALADVDVAHLLMGIAMAGMLTARLQTLPTGAWQAVFGVLTAWFGFRVLRDAQVSGVRALAGGHCAPHLAHSGAMLYMFVALTPPGAAGSAGHGAAGGMDGMGGTGTLGLPVLAVALALVLAGYSVWDLDQISGPGAGGHYSLAIARIRSAASAQALVAAPAQALAGVPAPAMADAPMQVLDAPVQALADAPAPPVLLAAPAGSAGAAGTAGTAGTAGSGIASVSSITSPAVATACRIAMGITMSFMLLIMI